MDDTLPELSGSRVGGVYVERAVVSAELGEKVHVGFRERMLDGESVADSDLGEGQFAGCR